MLLELPTWRAGHFPILHSAGGDATLIKWSDLFMFGLFIIALITLLIK